jgi:hypothetical protein
MPDLTPPPAKASGDAGHIAVHETIRQAIIALDGHAHPTSEVTGLDAALSGKASASHSHSGVYANASHTHSTGEVSALVELIEDTLGTKIIAGSNITVSYDDTAGTLTVAASGGGVGGLSSEEIQDMIATFLQAGSNISLSYVDGSNTLTVAVTGLGDAATKNVGTAAGSVAAGDHTHSGYAATSHAHTTSDVTGLTAALAAKADDAATTSALAGKAASSHTHTTSNVTGLDAALAGKSDTSHTHTAANVSDFAEVARDTLAAALVAGSGVTITPNDGADTITIAASGSAPLIPLVYSISGALTVAAGVHKIPWYGGSKTIQRVALTVGTAPTGAAILVDINKNGSTIWSTQANRATVATSATTGTTTTFNTTALADGDYLTIDVDQIGSTVAGSDLVVTIWVS